MAQRRVRVFTRGPGSGTEVTVFEHAEGMSPAEMQGLATELGAPTTAFVQPARRTECSARIRVFSPRRELPLEVAPVLAVAEVQHLKGECNYELGVISVHVHRVREGRFTMRMPRTVLGTIPIEDREAIASVFALPEEAIDPTLPIVAVSGAFGALLVPLASHKDLRLAELSLDLWPLLIEKARVLGVMLYVPRGHGGLGTFRSRMFSPGAGVAEDPATGSVAAPLAMLLVKHGVSASPVWVHQGRDDDTLCEIEVNTAPGSEEPTVSGGVLNADG